MHVYSFSHSAHSKEDFIAVRAHLSQFYTTRFKQNQATYGLTLLEQEFVALRTCGLVHRI